MNIGTHPDIGPRHPRWSAFVGLWLLIGLSWLAVLPWLARQPARAARIEALERAGIDPSAMYYSELEMMPDTLRRLEQLHERDRDLLWRVAPRSHP